MKCPECGGSLKIEGTYCEPFTYYPDKTDFEANVFSEAEFHITSVGCLKCNWGMEFARPIVVDGIDDMEEEVGKRIKEASHG